MLRQHDRPDLYAIINALGHTRDPQATGALLSLAADPQWRRGKEVALAEALVNLGDRRAAPLIGDMIKNTYQPVAQQRLRNAYWRLTGEQF
jgi:HEAT repeat protein